MTAKPISDDQRVLRQSPHRRKQNTLAASDRYVVMLPLKPGRTRHAAATALGHIVFDPEFREHGLLVVHLKDRSVVTVSVNESFFVHVRDLELSGPLRQEIAEKIGLSGEPFCVFISGEEVDQL